MPKRVLREIFWEQELIIRFFFRRRKRRLRRRELHRRRRRLRQDPKAERRRHGDKRDQDHDGEGVRLGRQPQTGVAGNGGQLGEAQGQAHQPIRDHFRR